MKRKYEDLRANLEEFVEQTDYSMLIVACLPDELLYVLQLLQGLDQQYPQHLVVTFPQAFVSASAYLTAIVADLRTQITAGNELREQRGEAPLPDPPPELADARRPPPERLYRLLQYLKSLLPNEREHSVVVGLLPVECLDKDDYARLMASIVPAPSTPEWMAPLRIVVYDDRSQPRLLPLTRTHRVETVLTFEVDFSTPALTDALARDAADPSVPVGERMNYLTQLAALDYSYQRYPDALQKYGVLFEYYRSVDVPAMQAICLLGAGDTLRAAGLLAEAKSMLQSGMALAMKHNLLPAALNLLLSLVDVCLALQHFPDAEGYAEAGVKVANGLMNPFARADLHEKQGDAAFQQRKYQRGIECYAECNALCEKVEYYGRWKIVLRKLVDFYTRANQLHERRQAEAELARVEQLERSAGARPVAHAHSHQGAVS